MAKQWDNRREKGNPVIRYIHSTGDADLQLVQAQNVEHNFPCHIHRSYTLGVVTSGVRVFHINGKEITITAPDGFIINPYQPHSCCQQNGAGHDYRVVSMNWSLMREIYLGVTGKNGLPYFPKVKISGQRVNALLELIPDSSKSESISDGEGFHRLLESIIKEYASKEPVEESFHLNIPFVKQVSKYIEQNAGKQIGLFQLSQMVHVSPFHLNRIFREQIGLPPKAYLLQVRIKQSVRLLLETRSISRVAYDMGFTDQSHFSRFFKKNVGVSPGRFLDINGSDKQF